MFFPYIEQFHPEPQHDQIEKTTPATESETIEPTTSSSGDSPEVQDAIDDIEQQEDTDPEEDEDEEPEEDPLTTPFNKHISSSSGISFLP